MLAEFILVGSAALTMCLGHRWGQSIDLVLAEPGQRLPRVQINAWQDDLQARGMAMDFTQDPEAVQTFRKSGMDLADYRQAFMVAGGVKVALGCSDPPLDRLVGGKRSDPVRIANLDELLAAAAYACSERSKTRDCFALYVLLTRYGYTLRRVYEVFQRAEHMNAFNIAQMRLRRCAAVPGDECYASLLENSPSVQDMRLFFNQELDLLARDRLAGANSLAPRHL